MDNVEYLRLLLDERIPDGGTESDTLFSDSEINTVLSEQDSDLMAAASSLWRIKAGILQNHIKSYKVGEESITFQSLSDRFNMAVKLAEYYASKVVSGSGSLVYSIEKPDVLHEDDDE